MSNLLLLRYVLCYWCIRI